jgi:hypothetical protein
MQHGFLFQIFEWIIVSVHHESFQMVWAKEVNLINSVKFANFSRNINYCNFTVIQEIKQRYAHSEERIIVWLELQEIEVM